MSEKAAFDCTKDYLSSIFFTTYSFYLEEIRVFIMIYFAISEISILSLSLFLLSVDSIFNIV